MERLFLNFYTSFYYISACGSFVGHHAVACLNVEGTNLNRWVSMKTDSKA